LQVRRLDAFRLYAFELKTDGTSGATREIFREFSRSMLDRQHHRLPARSFCRAGWVSAFSPLLRFGSSAPFNTQSAAETCLDSISRRPPNFSGNLDDVVP